MENSTVNINFLDVSITVNNGHSETLIHTSTIIVNCTIRKFMKSHYHGQTKTIKRVFTGKVILKHRLD